MMPHLGHTVLVVVVVAASVYVYVVVDQSTKMKTRKQSHCLVCERIYLAGVSFGLTFAGLDALKPPVISVAVAGTSTILIPSTARSATTDSA